MKKPTANLSLVLAAMLVLTACVPDDPADGTATIAVEAGSGDGTGGSPGADADAEGDGQGGGTGGECVVGTWRLDNDAWSDLLQSILDAETAGSTNTVVGEVLLVLNADGTYDSVHTGWQITMVMTEGTTVLTREGTDSGTWTGTGDAVALVERTPGSVVTGYVEVDGGRFDLPTNDGTSTDAIQDFTFTCSATTLHATTPDGVLLFTRE